MVSPQDYRKPPRELQWILSIHRRFDQRVNLNCPCWPASLLSADSSIYFYWQTLLSFVLQWSTVITMVIKSKKVTIKRPWDEYVIPHRQYKSHVFFSLLLFFSTFSFMIPCIFATVQRCEARGGILSRL